MRSDEKINLICSVGLIGFLLYIIRNLIKPNN